MEPTDNELHAGCLGNLNATWTFHGRSGHSARPWHADNAIHAPRRGDRRARGARRREPHEFDGLTFHEVASVTQIAGGIAGNVIPDRVEAHVNFRYAPGRTPEEAEARLRELCAGHGELRIDANAPSGAGRRTATRSRDALIAAGELARRAQAGVDAGRRVRRAPASPRSTSGRASRRRRTAATSRSRSPRCVRAYQVLEAFARDGSPPCSTGLRHVPVRAPRPRPGGGCGAAASSSSTSAWASRARRRPRSSARRWPTRSSRCRPTRAPTGCRSCARRSPAGPARRFGAPLDPDTEVIPTLGSKEAIFHLAQVLDGDLVAVPHARLPGLRARRAVRGQARSLELPLREEHGWLPDLDAVAPRLGARRRCCGSTTRTTRRRATAPLEFYERAAALAREHGFVLASDEAYSEIYFGAEPPVSALQVADRTQRRRVQHALQALVDARLPLRLRGRRPGAHRRAQALPARTSASRRRSSSSARRSRPGATRRTSTRCATRYRAKRDVAAAGARGRRAAQRGRRRDVLPLAATPGEDAEASPRGCSSAA